MARHGEQKPVQQVQWNRGETKQQSYSSVFAEPWQMHVTRIRTRVCVFSATFLSCQNNANLSSYAEYLLSRVWRIQSLTEFSVKIAAFLWSGRTGSVYLSGDFSEDG